MGIFSAVKSFMGFEEDYDNADERYDDDELDEEEEPRQRKFTRTAQRSKVIPITNRNDDANVQIVKPTTFDDARKAAEVIMRDQVVVFDVSGMRDSEEALRVVDFVSGTVYGLRGNIRKINTGIFIAAPRHIDISGDNIKDHTRNNFDWK